MHESAEGWSAVVAAPDNVAARRWLASAFWRPAYCYARRQGFDNAGAIARTVAAFEQVSAGPSLRLSLLDLLAGASSTAPSGDPLVVDDASAETDLGHLSGEPARAFQEAWTGELVRRTLGAFYADCLRDGRSDLYELFTARWSWGSSIGGPEDREARRARGRFRRTLRRVVDDSVEKPESIDAELHELDEAFPLGADSCAQCGSVQSGSAAAHVYAGYCPRCLLRIGAEPVPALEQVGPYTIVSKGWRDERGEVFRARQEGGKEVHLRIFDRAENVQYAQVAQALQHPNVITVHEAGVSDGLPYAVTEIAEVATLEQAVPLSRPRAMLVAREVASAVQAAHDLGLVHGALDVTAVKIDLDGKARVGDFGFVADSPAARANDVAALGAILECALGMQSAMARRPFASARDFAASVGGTIEAKHDTSSRVLAARERMPEIADVEIPHARRTFLWLVVGVVVAVGAVASLVRSLNRQPDGGPKQPDTTMVDTRREEALARLDALRTREAAEAHIKAWPRDVEGHIVLARAHWVEGQYDEAEAAARKAIALDAEASPAWRVVGFLALERDDPTGARSALATSEAPAFAVRLKTSEMDEADKLLAAGLRAHLSGNAALAQQSIEAAGRKRMSADIWRWSGVVAGDVATNERLQTQALALRPDYLGALVERGVARVKLNNYKGGLADLNQAHEKLPRSFAVLLHRGIAMEALGEDETALVSLAAAVEVRRDVSAVWITQATIHRRRRNWAGLLEAAAEIVRIEPTLALGHLERGRAVWNLGKRDEAEIYFQRALDKDPRLKAEIGRIKGE